MSTRWLSVLLCALALCLLLPAVALADYMPILESWPATVSAGQSFVVTGTCGDDTDTKVLVQPAGLTKGTEAEYVAETYTEGDVVSFRAQIQLPSGGDWWVSANSYKDGELQFESERYIVSCNPADVTVVASIERPGNTYATPLGLRAVVLKGDGTPAAGVKLMLYALGGSGELRLARTVTTDASGTARASVRASESYRQTYPFFAGTDPVSWQWSYPATEQTGRVNSNVVLGPKTKKLFTRYWDPGVKFTGVVKLVKGRSYQFVMYSANEWEPGRFTLTRSGSKVVDFDMKASQLPTVRKAFTVKATGSYTWKVTGFSGHSCTWLIW